MLSTIDLILILYVSRERLINAIKKIIFLSFSFVCIFTLFGLGPAQASVIQNDKLLERISNDYSNKFCNSIAFGLSKESAISFSNKENNLIFKNKKGFDNLDKGLMADKISISVVERCGYLVELKGEEGINKFKNEYLEFANSILSGE